MKTSYIAIVSVLAVLLASAPVSAENQNYTVRRGDSLVRIGQAFNTTPKVLRELNGLESDRINAGQVLKVPAAQPSATAVREESQTYTVRNGDTLSSIATSFSITVRAITAANSISNPNRLRIGQVLTIPGANRTAAAQAGPVPPEAAEAAPVQISNIQPSNVQPSGETAANMAVEADAAGAADIAVATAATDATDAEQPQTEQTQQTEQAQQAEQVRQATQTYTVRNRDTLSSIASSFNVTVRAITAANSISNPNRLRIGQVLTIPDANRTAASAAIANPVQASSASAASADAAGTAQAANKANPKPAAKTANKIPPKPAPPVYAKDLTVRDRLVEAGFGLLGVRYRYGGTSEVTGLDCSALVRNIFEKIGISLPRSSREQYREGEHVSKEDLQKGDLVFFSSSGKTPTHVGVYIGDNQFIHAASRAKQVVVSDLGGIWYDLRYLGARRIMDLWWEKDSLMPSDDAPPPMHEAPASFAHVEE